jgi:hypothetical protein
MLDSLGGMTVAEHLAHITGTLALKCAGHALPDEESMWQSWKNG